MVNFILLNYNLLIISLFIIFFLLNLQQITPQMMFPYVYKVIYFLYETLNLMNLNFYNKNKLNNYKTIELFKIVYLLKVPLVNTTGKCLWKFFIPLYLLLSLIIV